MRHLFLFLKFIVLSSFSVLVISCANISSSPYHTNSSSRFNSNYSERLPPEIETDGKKTVLVDPNVHAWGAYDANGQLIRAGIATAGGKICPPDDAGGDCQTTAGTYHIASLGDGDCYSKVYPKPDGGGLMPYCMFFHNGQALHGSPDSTVIEANVSHGCVRMRIQDAEWMRNNFAQVGTRVIIRPY